MGNWPSIFCRLFPLHKHERFLRLAFRSNKAKDNKHIVKLSVCWVQTHCKELKEKTFSRSEKHSRCYIINLLLKRKHDVQWKLLRTRGLNRERVQSTVTLYQHGTIFFASCPLTPLNQSPTLAYNKHSVAWARCMYIQWQFKVKIKLLGAQ